MDATGQSDANEQLGEAGRDGLAAGDVVLAGLVGAIERLSGEDRSGWPGPARVDRAIELTRCKDRLEAELLRAVGDADRDGAWRAEGALSAPSWLAAEAPLSKVDATRMVRSARLVRDHERTGKALTAGDLTVGHVDLLARAARTRQNLYAEHEDTLLDAATRLDTQRFGLVTRRWALLAEDQLAARGPYERFQRRHLHLSPTFGGMVAIDGMLDPEGGARVLTALQAIDRPDPTNGELPPRSLSQRMADALVTICDANAPARPTGAGAGAGTGTGTGTGAEGDAATGEAATGDGGKAGAPHSDEVTPESEACSAGRATRQAPPRPAITVTIDADTLTGVFPTDLTAARCDIEGVGPVAPEAIRRLACDAVLTRMVMSPSQVLDIGKPTRVIPDHLRRAVIVRDEACIAESCDAPPAWCDIHHVTARSDGGPTAEHNLVLLCRRHHVATHEGHWNITRQPDGWTTQPPPPPARPPP